MNEQFLETILALSTGKNSRIHGPAHWAGVAAAGHTLCELTPEADRRVVLAFAMLHDSMRQSDGLDPDHGARAAELAESLHESGDLELDAEQLSTLTEALTYHDKGRTSGDPTIGACWDSDRLNLYRVGITPKASLMSTEGGCSLAGTEWSKYFPSFRFAWPAIFLNYDALVGLGEPSEHIYLRFGDLPEGGISQHAAFTRPEADVSAFHGYRTGDTCRIDARRLMIGTETRMVRILLQQGRPLYVVEGRHIAMGGNGEPVLADAHIAHEVAPDDRIEVLPDRTELAECIEWWRDKRGGKPVGSFPYPWEISLSCDRSDRRPEDALTDYGLDQPRIKEAIRVLADLRAKVFRAQAANRDLCRDWSNASLCRQALEASQDLVGEMQRLRERSMTSRQREQQRMMDNWLREQGEWSKRMEANPWT